MRSFMVILTATLTLGGCVSGTDVASWDTARLAGQYGNVRGMSLTQWELYESELKTRNAFTPEQWERIQQRKIQPGDSSEFVLAAWGEPSETLHRSTADGGAAAWRYRHDTTRPEAQGEVVFVGNAVASIYR